MSRAWARAAGSVQVGIPLQQGAGHAVGPAETILGGIFATAAALAFLDVVFFQQFAGLGPGAGHGADPAPRDLVRELLVAVAGQAVDSHPLQWRPAVRRIPLLAGAHQRRA